MCLAQRAAHGRRRGEKTVQPRRLESGCLWVVHVVNSIDDWLCCQCTSAEVPSIETLEGVVAASKVGELDIDLAIVAVAEEADVDDFAVLA